MATRSFRQLVDAMPPARQQKLEKRFQESLAATPLDELRKAREVTQLQLEYVEALGGHLEIRAVFPDREVRISQFEEVAR